MTRAFVAAADEFDAGSSTAVSLDGIEVAVFNHDGELFAIANRCAHDGGPLCEGSVHGRLVAEVTEPGERDVERFADEPAVACPLHGWEFDLETGEHVGDATIQLPTFDVVEEDGTLYVER